MVSTFIRRVGILLLFLPVLGNCLLREVEYSDNPLFPPKGWRLGNRDLIARAPAFCGTTIDEPDTPDCRILCSSTGPCSVGPQTKRDLLLARSSENSTDVLAEEANDKLSKRLFANILQTQLFTYLDQQFTAGQQDPAYGATVPIIIANQVPQLNVAIQRNLVAPGFQIGTQGLCGCTVVTVVSPTAVHMGHYFEVPTWASNAAFQNSVLNFFGAGVPVGQGPQINPALFPPATTRVYIMTPRRGANNPNSSNYRVKVVQLKNQITNFLGAVQIVLYNYVPLDCNSPNLFASQRGNALFQFDPQADAAGNPGWRLFYENHRFSSTDPPTGAASALGIPDV